MPIRVAINGFGRIGRLAFRAALNDPKIKVVAINDLTTPPKLAHLLRYDSVHGPFQGTIEAKKDSIKVNKSSIRIFSEKDPPTLPWKKLGIDVVMECTGFFRTRQLMELHLKAGAKKVILSAPCKGDKKVKTLVMGVNDETYKGEDLVSNASCTTNCFAPLAKIINDAYQIDGGVMTTVHAYTSDQRILDAPHEDLRRAKAAALNIVPTSTGAAKAIAEVIPEMAGKCTGAAIRVPVACGSMVHFVAEIKEKNISVEDVNKLFRKAAKGNMKNILEYSEEALVSSDIIGNPNSCVFDSQLTRAIDDEIIVVVGWYDNEWGYSNRMIDIAKVIMKE
ncbi:MAG: type I glyceraldehyde-3-phosphate dehydrogenase [Nanoarchaeota archaeon]|nr:type I glyceraldehyde-3-phosphate dehydrogenase [Nanoarchaeota archaeon]